MKIIFFIFILLFLVGVSPISLFADDSDGFALELGRYYMSVTPKILEDGVQNDISFGMFYTDAMKMAWEIRFRSVNGAANDTISGIGDSLITRDRQVYEVFLLPLNFQFLKLSNFTMRAGAGGYYNYNSLYENGFFNDRNLYFPPHPEDHYSAYTNDFTGHAVGPLFDIGLSYNHRFFSVSLSVGCVPVYYLNREQTLKITPYMNPTPSFSVASESISSPYLYMVLDTAVKLKYFSFFFSVIGEYSRLKYTAAEINGTTGEWMAVETERVNKTLALEISLLINLGKSGFMPQIGYGRTFDEVTGGSNYLLLGVKKRMY
ncbi:MAG: hypothetical protein FWD26_00990 [Treponema sp.]|nr:hypothetical protein [Treponema sp.]